MNDVWNSIRNFDEPGIRIISYIASYFGGQYKTMFLLSSILTIGLTVFTIKKNTHFFMLSMILYIFLGDWHGSFNGVRQYLASAIIFSGHKFILEKKIKKYLVNVILATSFHISALPLILFYFIPKKRLKINQIIFMIIISIICLFSYEFIFDIISAIVGLKDGSFVITEYVTSSVNTFRILVPIAPLLVYFIFTQKEKLNMKDYFYVNMLFLNVLFFIVSSNSAYLARFTINTNIFTILSFPSILKGVESKLRIIITMVSIIFYFIYWYLEITKSDSLMNFNWIF